MLVGLNHFLMEDSVFEWLGLRMLPLHSLCNRFRPVSHWMLRREQRSVSDHF